MVRGREGGDEPVSTLALQAPREGGVSRMRVGQEQDWSSPGPVCEGRSGRHGGVVDARDTAGYPVRHDTKRRPDPEPLASSTNATRVLSPPPPAGG